MTATTPSLEQVRKRSPNGKGRPGMSSPRATPILQRPATIQEPALALTKDERSRFWRYAQSSGQTSPAGTGEG